MLQAILWSMWPTKTSLLKGSQIGTTHSLMLLAAGNFLKAFLKMTVSMVRFHMCLYANLPLHLEITELTTQRGK